MQRLALAGLAGALLVSGAFAQGADCTSPQVISGTGSFAYDTTGFTTSFFSDQDCGFTGFWQDGFFLWTVPSDGTYVIEALGTNTPQVSLFLGGDCSALCLDVAPDPSSPVQPVYVVDRFAGEQILVQVGRWESFQDGSVGTLEITAASVPPEDDCGTPLALTGLGPFSFDTTTATPSGGDGPACGGAPEIRQDLFFEWTSTLDSPFFVGLTTTGGQASVVVATGPGCPATCIADGQTFSDVALVQVDGVSVGDRVLLRLGNVQSPSIQGSFQILPGLPNTDCSTPTPISGEGTFPMSTTYGTPATFGVGEAADPCLFLDDPDAFFVWTPTCGGTYDITPTEFVHVGFWEGSDCSATCYTDFIVPGGVTAVRSFTAGQPYLIQVRSFVGGFVDFDLTLAFRGDIEVVCSPTTPHHEGGDVTLANSEILDVMGVDRLRVRAEGGPVGEMGLLLVSAGAGSSIPVGQGTLCLDLPFGRYDATNATNLGEPGIDSMGSFDASGTFVRPGAGGPGFSVPLRLPTPIGGFLGSGETWYYQLWYRDEDGLGAPSSNLSDAIRVTYP